MSTAEMMKRIAEASPRFKARMAGVLYFFSLLTAGFSETFVRGRLNYAGGYIAISGMVAMTLIVYEILKPVNRSLSLLAVFFAFVGLRQVSLQKLRSQEANVNATLPFAPQ